MNVVQRGVWMALLVATVAGCGGGIPFLPSFLGNRLEGSVGSSNDLQFDEVDVRKFPTGELQVRYRRTADGNNEVVCQVTVLPPAEGLSYGNDIDLLTHMGSVSRVIQDGTPFPPLKTGTIRFDSGAVGDGDDTRGRFNATFDNDRTIRGNFDAKLVMLGTGG